MIEVREALKLIEETVNSLPVEKLSLAKSHGFILAKDIVSPINMPPFRQSAMDGYALIASKLKDYRVVGESKTGAHNDMEVKEGEAIRIFTGASVPDSVDTIIIQEHVSRTNDNITIEKKPKKGANIRPIGEQVKEGDAVLQNGQVINEATIGFLAGLGITKINVYKKPKVCIIATGDELTKPGKKLDPGKIYESNSIMLKAALSKIGIKKVKTFKVKDTLKETRKAIKKCLNEFDVVLISGGISVGDYDYVKESLEKNKVEEIFYKINQKPGKPLFFGKNKNTLVFGLPGNPASSLTCFYVYVFPALRKLMGHQEIHLSKIKVKVSKEIKNSTGKSLFLKAKVENGEVDVLDGQNSSMLKTFAISNALAFVPADVLSIPKGEEIECYSLLN